MNVMVVNKYKDMLMSLNIDIMKSIEGVFNVDEIIDTFSNFYYDKMVLDITAIRDYQNIDNIQKLSMNINMENVILLLDNDPKSFSKEYISQLITLGIYNFTNSIDNVNYLMVNPRTYKDVVNTQDILNSKPKTESKTEENENNSIVSFSAGSVFRTQIIGIKNLTQHAGATSLIYMIMKCLEGATNACAIEVDKVDFMYFNHKEMISVKENDLLKEIMKRQQYNVILIDLNDYEDVEICTKILYLIEPSTLPFNKFLKTSKNVLNNYKDKTIVLNKCLLNKEDIATFEYETRLKVFMSVPPLDDRKQDIPEIRSLVTKLEI